MIGAAEDVMEQVKRSGWNSLALFSLLYQSLKLTGSFCVGRHVGRFAARPPAPL
jgi:hypothetical protein